MSQQINGVNIPGQWLTTEYIAEKQALSRRRPEPKWEYCDQCGDPYRKKHHCVFEPTMTRLGRPCPGDTKKGG